MAIRISIGGENLDLPQNFQLKVDFYSPVFNTLGSQSMTATLPPTPRNLELLGHPERLDNVTRTSFIDGLLSDGPYTRSIRINILSSTASGIELSFGTDESLLYSSWNDLKLRDIPGLPVYTPAGETVTEKVNNLISLMNQVYKRTLDNLDFRVFPVALEFEDRPDEPSDKDFPKFTILNDINVSLDTGDLDILHTTLKSEAREMSFGKDEDSKVSVPLGYGVSPFLRVGRFLHLLFDLFGYTLEENIFDTDPQLKQMVMLNNTMDAICAGYIDYKDLLPDCTVNDLLESLKARFGAVFFLNGNTKIARLMLIRDILTSDTMNDLTPRHSVFPSRSFGKPSRLVLKLTNNYERSATCDDELNFSEFLAKYSDYYDFESVGIYSPIQFCGFGRYFSRFNQATNHKTFMSSLFFDWDTKEKDYEEFSLSGKDMSLPMYTNVDQLNDLPWSVPSLPLYLSGVRNAHTAIKNSSALQSDDTLEQGTDLCFCFAHGVRQEICMEYDDGVRYGSPYCTDRFGKRFVDASGNAYIYSLVAVGNDGSYNRFFKDFDRFLRAANDQVSTTCNVSHSDIADLDLAGKCHLFGQPLLIDKASVTFPLAEGSQSELLMRTLRLAEPVPDVDSLVDNVTQPVEVWFVTSNIGDIQQRLSSRLLDDIRRRHQSVFDISFKYGYGPRSYFSDIRRPSADDCDNHVRKTIRYKLYLNYQYSYNDSTWYTPIDKGTVIDSDESYVTETWEAIRRSEVRPLL